MTDKEEIAYLKEQNALLRDIIKLKEECAKKPWPTRLGDTHPNWLMGPCIS